MSVFKSKNMSLNFKDAVGYLTFKDLEKYSFFKHAYSTRIGGVSKNRFKSMNLGFNNDSLENLNENFDIFSKALGFRKEKVAATFQIHEDKIKKVLKEDINGFTRFEGIDGLITNEPGMTLCTFHADCIAIYMADVKKKVVGLAHAGWKGTVKNIAGKLAEKFVSEYGSHKDDIVCAIGPGIKSCCFEVSGDVLDAFLNLDIPKTYISNGNMIDLMEVNRRFLIKFGLKNENIFKSDVCTCCNHDMLFSHRASKGKRGNNAAFIFII